MKPIVYTMASSGIRVGAWDHLKWAHLSPIFKHGKLLAARICVYAGEDDDYFTFITPEAYLSLESWMKHRSRCGEFLTKDSWVIQDLWNAAKLPRKEEKGKINDPVRLQSIGVKRLVEPAIGGSKRNSQLQNQHEEKQRWTRAAS